MITADQQDVWYCALQVGWELLHAWANSGLLLQLEKLQHVL